MFVLVELFPREHVSGRGDESNSEIVGVLDDGRLCGFRSKSHHEAVEVNSRVEGKSKMGCGDELSASADKDKGILQHVLAR